MYFRVGDYTCESKQDPVFLHIYSKKNIHHIAPKLVGGYIVCLKEVAVYSKYNSEFYLYANDKKGSINVVYSLGQLPSDHGKYCRDLLKATIPLCVYSKLFLFNIVINLWKFSRCRYLLQKRDGDGNCIP